MGLERQDTQGASDGNTPTPPEGTMRAVVQGAYGSPDVFRLAQIGIP